MIYAYLTGIQLYTPTAARILGQKFSDKLSECAAPLVHIDCTSDCFGTYSVEGWTRQQIVDQALNWVVPTVDITVIDPSWYSADKLYIDNWHKRNSTYKLYKGTFALVSGEHCYSASYADLYPAEKKFPLGLILIGIGLTALIYMVMKK